MKNIKAIILLFLMLSSCSEKKASLTNDFVIADGEMPAIAKDKNNNLHLVYGSGDSIMYVSSDNMGNTFSLPALISKLPGMYSFAMRGPQIAATDKGIVITACTSEGNIYSFYKENAGTWKRGNKVNDVDTIAKEGLMALSADGNNVFAVWLDLRENKKNKIYGAKSIDGGKTWSKNIMIYTSPDSSVCECCKPSVIINHNNVYVMFRNWINGNRDLYLIQSNDGGNNFEQALKLGNGSWKLDGCPMDGGNLAINNNGIVQTVWRREAKIYNDIPGMPEKEIGEGKGCTIETVKDKNIYAWSENGQVIIIKPNGEKKYLGQGNQPVLKTIDDTHLLCVWENNKQIHASVVSL